MNDYSEYDSDYCDGHECPCDCKNCRWNWEHREEKE